MEGAPTTAEAYLAAVRAEAKAMPDVLVAASASTQSPTPRSGHSASVAKAPPHARPPRRWTRALLSAFAKLQYRIERASADVQPASSPELNKESWLSRYWGMKAPPPTWKLVVVLDQIHIADALEQYATQLQDLSTRSDRQQALVSEEEEYPFPLTHSLSVGSRGRWLFALLVATQR